jgi:hypothetical protein
MMDAWRSLRIGQPIQFDFAAGLGGYFEPSPDSTRLKIPVSLGGADVMTPYESVERLFGQQLATTPDLAEHEAAPVAPLPLPAFEPVAFCLDAFHLATRLTLRGSVMPLNLPTGRSANFLPYLRYGGQAPGIFTRDGEIDPIGIWDLGDVKTGSMLIASPLGKSSNSSAPARAQHGRGLVDSISRGVYLWTKKKYGAHVSAAAKRAGRDVDLYYCRRDRRQLALPFIEEFAVNPGTSIRPGKNSSKERRPQ